MSGAGRYKSVLVIVVAKCEVAMEQLVTLAVSGPIGVVTLRRPLKRNALTTQMVEQLEHRLRHAIEDETIRVVVLTHEGPIFCAGWDVNERLEAPQDSSGLARTIQLLLTSHTPVLAALYGGAVGAGMALVASCDVVTVAETAQFAFSEVRIGTVPYLVSLPVLRKTPLGSVAELFLTGRPFGPRKAETLGLVSKVVPAHAVNRAVEEFIDEFLAAAPNAVGATKRLLGISGGDVATRLQELSAQSASMFSSPEATEGLRAFADSRDPEWVTRPRPGYSNL